MNTQEDNVWKSLLAQSAPTFAGAMTPPLGLAARVLAQTRDARVQEAAWERVGLRAILASLAAVGVLAAVTLSSWHRDDVDVPVRGLAAIEDMQVS
jgi:uncharacterized membrane protein